ncbi:uncharacterized protein LOC132055946 [Lycium ferocissimum]|uniref:uncharacterized protein LOC132055946 n=1 Tax=Lycium ferocissimum TaxID=112874 RepID=UPI0028166FEB|nr:uncharacterized protein LOC132055946 [Lycium ferocissimum]
MEIKVKSPPRDFNLHSACTTPYISASSSPQRYGTSFLSAPTSPARVSALYDDEFNMSSGDALKATGEVPFNWEEKPGTPKARETNRIAHDEDDFVFDFSGQLERSSFSAADELFDGGKIRPLKPPPRLIQCEAGKPFHSPRSPKQRFKQTFSPARNKKEFDPFAAAIEHSARTENDIPGRGKIKNPANSRPKKTRSLSVPDLLFDPESNQETTKTSSFSLCSVSSSISLWYRKWKLKDLFLFRSASEGRASSKDHLNKFLKKTHEKEDDVKSNSSFRSTASSVGSSSVSSSLMRRREVSAHELHYTLNRAFSEEMKRKTFLPYKKLGVLGCLGFIPSTMDDINFRSVASSMSMTRRQ